MDNNNLVNIEIDLGEEEVDTPRFFCPICGAHIGFEASDNCKHIMAMYTHSSSLKPTEISHLGKFIAVNPRYSKLCEEILEDDEGASPVDRFVEETASPSVMLIL